MTTWQRVRVVVNWINLMTPIGLAVARIGGCVRHRGPSGLVIYAHYRLGFPIAGAFTLGNVIVTRNGPEYLLAAEQAPLLGHESTHSVQAALLGPFFLPLYVVAAAYSWAISADVAGRNLFEVWAGLERGNYLRGPLRPGLARVLRWLRPRATG